MYVKRIMTALPHDTCILLTYDLNFVHASSIASCSVNFERFETFEEHPILTKYKEGDNFNHRNTLSISRIKI